MSLADTDEDTELMENEENLQAFSESLSIPVAPATQEKAQPQRSARGRWRLGAVLIALALLPALLYFARTETGCGWLIDGQLEALRQRTGIRVVRGSATPVGWTGVSMSNVLVRRPDDGGSLWLAIEHLEVYPDVLAALAGDVRPAEVTLGGVEANILLGEGGDLELIQGMRRPKSNKDNAKDTPVITSKPSGHRSIAALVDFLPMLEITDAHLRIEDRDGRFPVVVTDSQRLSISKHQRGPQTVVEAQATIDMHGYGPGKLDAFFESPSQNGKLELHWQSPQNLTPLASRFLQRDPRIANTTIEARGAAIHWPLQVALFETRVEGLSEPMPWTVTADGEEGRPHLLGSQARSLVLKRQADQWRLEGDDALIMVSLPGRDGPHNVPLGDVSVAVTDQRAVSASIDFEKELGQGNATARWDADTQTLSASARLQAIPLDPYGPLIPKSIAQHMQIRTGLLSGILVMDYDHKSGDMNLHSEMDLRDGTVYAGLLSSRNIDHVQVDLGFDITGDVHKRTFNLSNATLTMGALKFVIDGFWEGFEDDEWHLRTSVKVPSLDAQAALESVPKGLIPVLEGYRFEGPLGGHIKLDTDTRKVERTRLDVEVEYEDVKVVAAGPLAPIPVLAGDFRVRAAALPGDLFVGPADNEEWVPLDSLPKIVHQAITAAEDGHFWKHKGFALGGIRAALIKNIKTRRMRRGGSTISQQVIKNLFLSHERTLSRKLQEVVLTWYMEQTLTKDRILEIYLNMLHLGPEIYGIRKASRILFRKAPHKLSLRESVFLGCVLPNPNHFVRLYSQRRIPADRLRKMRNILINMEFAGFISEQIRERAASFTDQGIITIAQPPQLVSATPSSVPD